MKFFHSEVLTFFFILTDRLAGAQKVFPDESWERVCEGERHENDDWTSRISCGYDFIFWVSMFSIFGFWVCLMLQRAISVFPADALDSSERFHKYSFDNPIQHISCRSASKKRSRGVQKNMGLSIRDEVKRIICKVYWPVVASWLDDEESCWKATSQHILYSCCGLWWKQHWGKTCTNSLKLDMIYGINERRKEKNLQHKVFNDRME